MRIGEKCKFVLSENLYALKAGRKYTGIYAGGDRVRYQRFTVIPEEIIPIQKPAVKKEKAPTASDYKNFSDLCFEVAIRYRDNWQSVISGKKFEEGDWNGLQAGHGVSRQHWANRHNPCNCHAITSGENFHMSLGTTSTIAKYWKYVSKKYGQDVVDRLLDNQPESPQLTIAYLKEDCKKQYYFLYSMVTGYLIRKKAKLVEVEADYYIKWRCEKYPKTKADGVLKVLDLIERGEI